MFISPEKRPEKKIDNAYVVWFEESNSWVQLEEPAWYIYRNFTKNIAKDDFAAKFARRYGVKKPFALNFIQQITIQLQNLTAPSYHPQQVHHADTYYSPDPNFSVIHYKFNGKVFAIAYGSKFIATYIHPFFSHLECAAGIKPDHTLNAFFTDQSFILKVSDKAWVEENVNMLKRRIFIQITGLMYEKDDGDWMTYIHGSAVGNRNEAIILTTASGSGKSTLAALLCARGLRFLSDDFIPVDAKQYKVHPFPAALSVKEGAFPLLYHFYPPLQEAEIIYFEKTGKKVKYLPFPDDSGQYSPLPVRNMIFVKYDPSTQYSFKKITVLEAFKRFNEEAWVSSSPSHAQQFINWFSCLNFFELEYSDNHRTIEGILSLFASGK